MAKEHIAAGTVVAREFTIAMPAPMSINVRKRGRNFPSVGVCRRASPWKTYRLAKKPAGKQNESA